MLKRWNDVVWSPALKVIFGVRKHIWMCGWLLTKWYRVRIPDVPPKMIYSYVGEMERPLSCHDRECGFDSRRNCQICKRLYAASQLHSPAKRLVMVRVHALPPTMGVWCKGSTVRNQAESGKYKLRLSCQPQPAPLQGQELTVTSNKLGV